MGQFYRAVLLDANGKIHGWVDPVAYGCKPFLADHLVRGSPIVSSVEMLLANRGKPYKLIWAAEYAAPSSGSKENLYTMCTKDMELFPEESDTSLYTVLVNHTKKQFVSKERSDKYTEVAPLPLLTCETDCLGAGGYVGRDHAIIGYWAGDDITLEKVAPMDYIEIIFDIGKVVR